MALDQVNAEIAQVFEVLEFLERTLGPEHPETLVAKRNLAATLSEREEWAEAERLRREVLEGMERTLGPEQLETLDAKQRLAAILRERKA